MTKRARSGYGSHLYQNVTDPQHWEQRKIQEKKRTGRYDKGQENYRKRITEDKGNEKELARK